MILLVWEDSSKVSFEVIAVKLGRNMDLSFDAILSTVSYSVLLVLDWVLLRDDYISEDELKGWVN